MNEAKINNATADVNIAEESVYVEIPVENGFYKGYAIDGVPNGEGLLKKDNGDVYEGEFEDGYLTGKGKILLVEGDVYEGEWDGGRFNGHGKMTSASGDVFEGEWDDDYIVSGKGKIVYETVPGFDDSYAFFECKECEKKYNFLYSRGYAWALEEK